VTRGTYNTVTLAGNSCEPCASDRETYCRLGLAILAMSTLLSSVALTSLTGVNGVVEHPNRTQLARLKTGKGDTDRKPTLPYYSTKVTLAVSLPYRASANGAEPSVPSFPPLH